MKTIEEKAKAYDEIIERAKTMLAAGEVMYGKENNASQLITNIIPDLKESEDERIRKMCITAVNIAASADGGLLHSEASECLAWLEEQKDKNCLACDQHLKGYIAGRKVTEEEKQKEQKPAHTAKEMWKEMRLEVYAQASGNRHEPNYSDDSTKMFSLCDIDEIFEKIGNSTVEQKPAEKQDYSGLTDFERAIHRGFLCAGVENVPVTIIKETAQDCMSRIKPAEWSDKDKNIFNLVLDLIKHSDDCSGLLDKELAVKWFAELPSRFVPQPKQELDEESKKVILKAVAFLNIYGNFLHNEGLEKESNAVYKVADSLKLLSIQPKQEWREEDEDVIRTIEIALGTSKTVSHDNYLRVMDWLRTLRPKPHLKLSEEQICTLERICSNLHLRASDDAPKLDEIIKLLKLK